MIALHPPEEFHSERLHLRRLAMSDAPVVFQYAGNSKNTLYIAWSTHSSIEDPIAFLEYSRKAFDAGEEFSYAIEIAESGKCMGWIGMKPLKEEASVYMGYFLDHAFWNRGYATEAASCLFQWLRMQEDVRKIVSSCHIKNAASCRVLEKTGLFMRDKIPAPHDFPNLPDEKPEAYVFST